MSNKIFSYSIEDSGGRLIITVEGLYAQAALQLLRSEVESGRGWRALARMSPLPSLNRLARQAARTTLTAKAVEASAGGLDLETIFKQGFADSYDQFAGQIDRYAATLNQLRTEFEGNLLKRDAEAKAAVVAAATAAPAAEAQAEQAPEAYAATLNQLRTEFEGYLLKRDAEAKAAVVASATAAPATEAQAEQAPAAKAE